MRLYIVETKRGRPLWLTDYRDDFSVSGVTRRAVQADLTPLLIGKYLDQRCENCNCHDYVGAHKALAKLLIKESGLAEARLLMRAILKRGGLHKMAGC